MVVVLAGLFMGCKTLLSLSICYVMLCYLTHLVRGIGGGTPVWKVCKFRGGYFLGVTKCADKNIKMRG